MQKIVLLMMAALMFTSCAGYKINQSENVKPEKPFFGSDSRIAVAMHPSNTNQQADVDEFICSELSKKCEKVTPIGKYDNLANVMEKADFIVTSEVLDYKDRETMDMFGRRDSILIEIKIVDLKTGKEVDNLQIRSTGRWFHFGRPTPDAWAKKPLQEYVSSLFK